MARAYKPYTPFNMPVFLFKPTSSEVKGSLKKVYPAEGILFFASFRTFGGSEVEVNGVYSVESTGVLETWYRPDIKADCRIQIDGVMYEILGTPEDIGMRHQYLSVRVRAIKGGA